MKRTLLTLLLAAFAAGAAAAAAAEAVAWGEAEYQAQFKYFTETGSPDPSGWEAMPPAERESALREAEAPAESRLRAIAAYYEAAMQKWDSAALRDYCSRTTPGDVKTVKIWMGALKGTLFENKLALARAMLNKAAAEGLTDADAAALQQHLQPQAIAELRSSRAAAEMMRRQAEAKPRAALSQSSERLGKLGPDLDSGKLSGMYDNARAGQGGSYSKKYEVPKAVVGSIAGGVSKPLADMTKGAVSGALGAPLPPAAARTTAATTLGHNAPGALAAQKSSAWTSDAYGITVETPQGRQTYRDTKAAEAAIRRLPAGSITRVTLYGHGSPGMQTVGPDATYDSGSTADLFKGKMARNGVITFAGCNTASIGGSTLNPAVGLSMTARRLLYFSVPYWGDRLNGVPADQARQQWEKEWNADLSRDTSLGVNGAIVCGYRTFGLVPGRLPGLTRLMGNQEATEPGYIAGKKVCYQNGREVPAP